MYMRYWAGPFRNSCINESGYERYGNPTKPCWLLDTCLHSPHADLTECCTRLEHQPESSWDQSTILIMLRATRNCERLPTPLAGQLQLAGSRQYCRGCYFEFRSKHAKNKDCVDFRWIQLYLLRSKIPVCP